MLQLPRWLSSSVLLPPPLLDVDVLLLLGIMSGMNLRIIHLLLLLLLLLRTMTVTVVIPPPSSSSSSSSSSSGLVGGGGDDCDGRCGP